MAWQTNIRIIQNTSKFIRKKYLSKIVWLKKWIHRKLGDLFKKFKLHGFKFRYSWIKMLSRTSARQAQPRTVVPDHSSSSPVNFSITSNYKKYCFISDLATLICSTHHHLKALKVHRWQAIPCFTIPHYQLHSLFPAQTVSSVTCRIGRFAFVTVLPWVCCCLNLVYLLGYHASLSQAVLYPFYVVTKSLSHILTLVELMMLSIS